MEQQETRPAACTIPHCTRPLYSDTDMCRSHYWLSKRRGALYTRDKYSTAPNPPMRPDRLADLMAEKLPAFREQRQRAEQRAGLSS